jgi:hypothetical protein
MIAHLVLFRPRPDLSTGNRERLADAFAAVLRDIPSIRRARVGPRVMHGAGYELLMRANYDYAAILEFDDEDGLKAYLAHPAHQELGQRFFTTFEEALMYDFALQDGIDGMRALL